MPTLSDKHILIVDDEVSVRESLSLLFRSQGYCTTTAEDGFDALLQLRTRTPNLITSDLNMPHMSGFELLSVLRRRFPQIPVIAISGAYDCAEEVPGGIIADGFHSKGQHDTRQLLEMVADLLLNSAERTLPHQSQSAPVWIPRNGKDSQGVPFIVLTCTDCLRSFPLSVSEEPLPEIQETDCLFCPNTVRYIIDFSLSVASASPGKQEATGNHTPPAARRQAGAR